jgi:hypothetical protein
MWILIELTFEESADAWTYVILNLKEHDININYSNQISIIYITLYIYKH